MASHTEMSFIPGCVSLTGMGFAVANFACNDDTSHGCHCTATLQWLSVHMQLSYGDLLSLMRPQHDAMPSR